MPDSESLPDQIADMSFEEAMQALEKIVSSLETGDAALEDSINLYTRGTELKRHCEEKLKDAQTKIEKITLGTDNAPSGTEPLDMD